MFALLDILPPRVYFLPDNCIPRVAKTLIAIISLHRNLPRAIYISMPLVTIIYVLANVAYLAVLSPYDMATTKAIAVVSTHHTQLFDYR